MTSESLLSPNKKIINLFELSYGSTILRMNNSQDDLSLPLGDFQSIPSLKLRLPKYSGTFERALMETEFDYAPFLLFAEAITSGRAFAECYTRAWQWVRDESSDRLSFLYAGRVANAILNPGGRQGILKISQLSPKSETKRNAGLVVANQCNWTFGNEKTCGIVLSSITETAQMTFIDGNTVVVSGMAVHPAHYWVKGRIEADGVSLNIRAWDAVDTFTLGKTPPLAWEDEITLTGFKDVTLIPGCDKLLPTCKYTWNNEANFMGIGIAVPNYNPLFEGP